MAESKPLFQLDGNELEPAEQGGKPLAEVTGPGS